jgi:hypothetical protein
VQLDLELAAALGQLAAVEGEQVVLVDLRPVSTWSLRASEGGRPGRWSGESSPKRTARSRAAWSFAGSLVKSCQSLRCESNSTTAARSSGAERADQLAGEIEHPQMPLGAHRIHVGLDERLMGCS